MRYGKRALDVILVLLSVPVVVPVVAICAIALLLEGGQPFFRQGRLGRGGRVFQMWKLRTMVHNSDEMLDRHLTANPCLRAEWAQKQKLKDDPRITPLGGLLRATSLDELPQLWNVLVGQMSLVGARPMMVNQLELYGEADWYFMQRPGLTGPWQVGDRNDIGFRGRADIDEAYCRDITLGRDLQILFETIAVVLRGTGY
ncbi:sugar transferase [Phaeobacter sp. B1627]|uniref:sugar transferase n=1 Tax=Phaeobacter sp. B1627 TaxID=2583809 RepID=UPI0021072E4F|nr:sugar transferase [Phaeobacter sp. B1627]